MYSWINGFTIEEVLTLAAAIVWSVWIDMLAKLQLFAAHLVISALQFHGICLNMLSEASCKYVVFINWLYMWWWNRKECKWAAWYLGSNFSILIFLASITWDLLWRTLIKFSKAGLAYECFVFKLSLSKVKFCTIKIITYNFSMNIQMNSNKWDLPVWQKVSLNGQKGLLLFAWVGNLLSLIFF